jgi:aminopeptidase YwaD
MFQTLISMLQAEVSGVAAKNYVAEITRFHRIQASPGFRAAAQYVADALREASLDARVISYPADGETTFWSMRTFLEWSCKEASLFLLDKDGKVQRKLADYRDEKISVIQRSMPADGEFEVVALDTGEERADYEGVDVKGKLVFTRGRVDRVVELAVKQYGAAGVLFDGMMRAAPVRERIDLPDARQYTSFWFRGGEAFSTFGFVLTPRQGDALREQCREAKTQGKPPVRVRAKVDSSLYAGQMEVVEALLPGETDEEIVLVAHLCHPQPSANDNASGAGALMEVARALAKCVQDGRLVKPKRAIRFLWLPEMSGTYAYLASHENEIPRMIAGLNLDMVGEDQEKCGSSLLLESPAVSTSSFAPALAQHIRDLLLGGAHSHAGQGDFPLCRYADTPFSGGSDHYILSDPKVGVPTPMIIQWPDKYYHTSQDTIDKVSPEMLATVGVLTATYGYWLANAGQHEAEWLAHEMTARFKRQVMQQVQDALAAGPNGGKESSSGSTLKREISFLAGRHSEALATVRRLANVDAGPFQAESAAFVEQELKRAVAFLGYKALAPTAPPSGEWEEKAASLIPMRKYRGPLSLGDLLVKAEDREALYRLNQEYPKFGYTLPVLALYWVDGERSLSEVADLLEMETGMRMTEPLVKHFEFLSRIGGIELRSAAQK